MKLTVRLLALMLVLLTVFGGLSVIGAAAAEASPGTQQEDGRAGYALHEEEAIGEDAVPLGAGPAWRPCCVMHFILMLCALGMTVFYTHEQKSRQARMFELRAALQ